MARPAQPPRYPPGPVLALCGWSGSGKTTLLEKLIPRLKARGLTVALVKNDAHHFVVDQPGKDSDRLFNAGANIVLGSRSQMFSRRHADEQRPLPVLLADLLLDHDLVLVEGHKSTPLPKFWLEGGDRPQPDNLSELLGVLPWDADRASLLMARLEAWLPTAWLRAPVYGGVLVGGKSHRMGREKAGMHLAGKSFLARAEDALAPHVERVVLLGEGSQEATQPETLRLPDAPELAGPLAGLASALRWAPGASWVITACDLPLITPSVIRWLLDQRRPGVWGILPSLSEGKLEPLLALYEGQTAGLLAKLAATGPLAPHRLIEHEKVITVTPPAELAACWHNVNTPADLDEL